MLWFYNLTLYCVELNFWAKVRNLASYKLHFVTFYAEVITKLLHIVGIYINNCNVFYI